MPYATKNNVYTQYDTTCIIMFLSRNIYSCAWKTFNKELLQRNANDKASNAGTPQDKLQPSGGCMQQFPSGLVKPDREVQVIFGTNGLQHGD